LEIQIQQFGNPKTTVMPFFGTQVRYEEPARLTLRRYSANILLLRHEGSPKPSTLD